MQCWFMKSEPGEFSIDALLDMPNRIEHLGGVQLSGAQYGARPDKVVSIPAQRG